MSWRSPMLLVVPAVLLMGACASTAAGSPESSTAPAVTIEQFDVDAARQYCEEEGGTTELRRAYAGTNLEPSAWVALPATVELCRFVADDESRIYLDLKTLYSEQPTLAAAAYLAKLPLPQNTGGANPAAVSCAQNVLGTSSFGTNLNGGGWVNRDDPVFTVVDLCVFADFSAIDQWGIAYYTEDIVRGADLAEVFRFDTDDMPDFYPDARD